MPRFVFDSEALRRGLSLSRIVKPETGDFCFRFSEKSVSVFTYDKRKYSCSVIPYSSTDVLDGYQSEEFYVTEDRVALFDADLERVSVTVGDGSLKIRVEGQGPSRSASLKPKSVRSRRPPVPGPPQAPVLAELDAGVLDALLRQLSCSAQVRETKTEDDMRVNQVHFYADSGCAMSIARYYATVAQLDGLMLDLSIISSDIPLIRNFCSRATGKVRLHQDGERLYVSDSATGSSVAFSRVATKKPPLSILPESGFLSTARLDGQLLRKSLGWAALAMEGTQRLGFKASRFSDGVKLEIRNGTEEMTCLPCDLDGDGFDADFPVKHFASILGYLEKDVILSFGHKDAPSVLCIQEPPDASGVSARHYLMSMVKR